MHHGDYKCLYYLPGQLQAGTVVAVGIITTEYEFKNKM